VTVAIVLPTLAVRLVRVVVRLVVRQVQLLGRVLVQVSQVLPSPMVRVVRHQVIQREQIPARAAAVVRYRLVLVVLVRMGRCM
ncbi:MAG: hypothetical protein VKM97_07765, partial [Cyanobacteriota bacterium]|nr:hypothetical protein [Cyanobacteriota bacterium]